MNIVTRVLSNQDNIIAYVLFIADTASCDVMFRNS